MTGYEGHTPTLPKKLRAIVATMDGPTWRVFDSPRDSIADAADTIESLLTRVEALETLLGRIRQWDMLDVTADGPYWKRTIDEVLNNGNGEGT